MRQKAGRLVAATAAVLAFGAYAAGGPAAAADPVLRVEAPRTAYVPEHGRGAGELFSVELDLGGDSPAPVAHDVELVVDASALAGTARVEDTGACEAADGVFTCAWPSVAGGTSVRPFRLTGAEGVRAGARAPITVTARASDAAEVSVRTEAVVGRPLLAEREHEARRGLAPGEPFTLIPGVANHGELAAPQGIGVRLLGTTGLRLAQDYGNCRYKPAPDAAVYCLFGTPVEAGRAYEFSAPFRFTPAEDLMYAQVSYEAWVVGGEDPWAGSDEDPADYGVRGGGPELTLRPVADEGFASSGGGWLDVGTAQTADYQAVGGVIEGSVGETVELALGVQNAGPGSMALSGGTGRYRVTPPEGTAILPGSPGWPCEREGAGPAYVCELPEVFPAGTEDTAVFRVRIDRPVPGAPGAVEALPRAGFPPRDGSPANDRAALTLRVHPGSASPSPTPSASPSTSPTPTPAPAGSMAPTGTSSVLPWLIAASAAALGLGAVTLAMVRRPSVR